MIIKTALSRIFVFGNPEHANKITRYSLVPSDLASNVGCQSTKKLILSAIFLVLIFLCPSIRADIVYSNTVSIDDVYINGGVNFGNTFSNTASASNIKSVSLYFINNGVQDDVGYTYWATGTMKLGIYATTLNSVSGLYDLSGTALVTAELNMSSLNMVRDPDTGYLTNSTIPALYTFDFTNSLGDRNLSANARYAFFTDFSDLTDVGALHFYVNNSSYSGQNYISDNIGFPDQSVVGTVEVAAVPEPGTLILTGSVLAVGGIGAYIKRRRKNRAQVENVA
ncbi:MAG: PEP-CTERM sorting domain-containing protein [Planctomycetota bacterium]|nr:PEP-CTERM sorting domain-containing protein [Planctomycetota bacterium]